MVLTSLSFNAKGHAKHMENGIEYDEETLAVELVDNSDKAIRSKNNHTYEDYINIINGHDFFSLRDTGIGINNTDLYELVLRYYNINENVKIGMNKSGIGLKYALNNLMKEKYITFILSKTDNGDDYAMAVLTKISDEIKIEDTMKGVTSKKTIKELIDAEIENDGFMILIIKQPLYSDNMVFEGYMDILKKYISYTKDPSKHTPYDDLKGTTETLFRDDIRSYKIYLNNEIVNYKDHINDESDELMFELKLFMSIGNGHPVVYIDEIPKIRYRYTKKDHDVLEEENIRKSSDIKQLAVISFYKNKNGDKIEPSGSYINYRMEGERNQCKCPLSQVRGCDKKTMNYLKIDCMFTDRKYCRDEILKSIKTSTNHTSYEPSDDLKRLNITLTKICKNPDILEHFEWKLVKWNKTTSSISNTGND